MAALSLFEYAAEPKLLVAGVAKALMEESDFFDALPFQSVGTLSVKVIRETGLPSVGWRKIGAAHGSAKAPKPSAVEEQAYSVGNSIDLDKVYLKDTGVKLYNPFTYQMLQTTKAIARDFNDACINNTPTLSSDKPVGLFHRVMNDLASAQRITADPAGASSGLDISPDAASFSANCQSFLDKLDVLIYQLADHKANVLLMNDTMKLRAWSIMRQANVLDTTKDRFGREFLTYKGARFIDMGFKTDDATRIIGNVETLNGTALTAGTATSIYAVRLGPEYFTGWQEYALDVSDPKMTDDQVTYRSVIDWCVGVALSHPRSVARLYGVVAA